MTRDQNNPSLPPGTKIPDHIAIVMDGNRRWARSRGLSTIEGHKAGYNAIRKLIDMARRWGVHTLTLWAFSTENWERSSNETENIMRLARLGLREVEKEADKKNIRFVHIGRKDRLPQDVLDKINELEEKTKNHKTYVLNLALDYGGRDEIVRAVQKVVHDGVPEDKIDEKLFASYLDTGDQPYPYVDLFIRPSGEQRTSGLLPWQTTYAEYYWEVDYLPDFTPDKLKAAILDYSRRRRRFGGDDIVEHLEFDPKLVAHLELQWRHALALGEDERLRDLVVRYVKEHYGLSRDLAKKAGLNLAKALILGREENWDESRKALVGLYRIVQKTLRLAFEPKLVANLEIDLWRSNGRVEDSLGLEQKLRELYAELFRVSELQASKAAHLLALATREQNSAQKASGTDAQKHWDHYRWLLERFYTAIKERVA